MSNLWEMGVIRFQAGTGHNVVIAGGGDDTIDGGDDSEKYDFLFGSEGEDIIRGHKGKNFIVGGGGHDPYLQGGEDFNVILGDGFKLETGLTFDLASLFVSNPSLPTQLLDKSKLKLEGYGWDRIIGGAGTNIVIGGDGNDTIDGNSGPLDILFGNGGC